MRILVTNDDGPESPFVAPLVRAAASLGSVTVVLPDRERSWTAKAMTRYADLPLARRDLQDGDGNAVTGFTLGGTPADCVNAGCYLLGPGPPDLVLSGVNAGENTGVSYASSSGTIGACLEANIALVPAIALSQQLTPAGFASWAARAPAAPGTELGEAAARLDRLLPALLADLLPALGPPDIASGHGSTEREAARPVTWSVNFPARLASDWRLVPCALERGRYGSCFERRGDMLRHVGAVAIRSRGGDTIDIDVDVLAGGCVSLTRIDPWAMGQAVRPF